MLLFSIAGEAYLPTLVPIIPTLVSTYLCSCLQLSLCHLAVFCQYTITSIFIIKMIFRLISYLAPIFRCQLLNSWLFLSVFGFKLYVNKTNALLKSYVYNVNMSKDYYFLVLIGVHNF